MSPAQTPTIPGVECTFEVAVTHKINAPTEAVYGVFADYREAHPRILPPSFFVGMTVEQGGYGAGTIIDVKDGLPGGPGSSVES